MTKAHQDYVKAHTEHTETSGCIIYCNGKYEEGKAHSHRWHAANQAKGETRVPYNEYEMWAARRYNLTNWDEDKIKLLETDGAVQGKVYRGTRKTTALIKPFYRMFTPFSHNAHHIIPSAELESCINKVMEMAKPRQPDMQNLVVGGLLKEPYNNNDQPNMIVLPTTRADSKVLGLPKHLGSHPNYSAMVGRKVTLKFNKAYRSIAQEVKAMQHVDDADVPAMGPTLVSISEGMYEAIISLAQSQAHGGEKLDALENELKSKYKPAVIR